MTPKKQNAKQYKRPNRICLICQTSFVPSGAYQKYCQQICKTKANKPKDTVRKAKFLAKNPTYFKDYSKKYNKTEKAKDLRLKRLYGISLDEYKQISTHQQGICGICGREPTKTPLHLDHKHQPKEKQLRKKKEQLKIRAMVRGLLCWSCNTSIAKFRDNPILLRKAADYIDNPPARSIIVCR